MVQQLSRPVIEKQQEQPTCCHHWISEAPSGPVSNGICRLCGEEKEFKNYIETAPTGNDAPAAVDGSHYPVLPSFEDLNDLESLFSSGSRS